MWHKSKNNNRSNRRRNRNRSPSPSTGSREQPRWNSGTATKPSSSSRGADRHIHFEGHNSRSPSPSHKQGGSSRARWRSPPPSRNNYGWRNASPLPSPFTSGPFGLMANTSAQHAPSNQSVGQAHQQPPLQPLFKPNSCKSPQSFSFSIPRSAPSPAEDRRVRETRNAHGRVQSSNGVSPGFNKPYFYNPSGYIEGWGCVTREEYHNIRKRCDEYKYSIITQYANPKSVQCSVDGFARGLLCEINIKDEYQADRLKKAEKRKNYEDFLRRKANIEKANASKRRVWLERVSFLWIYRLILV